MTYLEDFLKIEQVADRPLAFFSLTQANAALVYVRAIVEEIAALNQQVDQTVADGQRLVRAAHWRQLSDCFEELNQLGVRLVSDAGLWVDFLSRQGDRDIYLSWSLGDQAIGQWRLTEEPFHERRPIETLNIVESMA